MLSDDATFLFYHRDKVRKPFADERQVEVDDLGNDIQNNGEYQRGAEGCADASNDSRQEIIDDKPFPVVPQQQDIA